ncbi:MAG: class II fructose-1,6-bisphosphate aldolase [Sedimentisphaerales bacterium]|nr:class II fructose-1,6-bisphosphate aldolase [Sedimentisphaerales bacterium]
MPLVSTTKMFKQAYDGGFAIGAFNVNNMEIMQAIVDACKEENAPLILQISKGAREYANVKYLRALIDCAIEDSGDLPISMHLDHGDSYELCEQCVKDGFTSVMIDKSHENFATNVAVTKQVVDYAHKYNVTVEAEIGQLGGIEEEVVGVSEDDVMNHLTDPAEAEEFVKQTGCDSLAVACGTSHGAFKFKSAPKLAFDVIDEIARRLPGFPLVMHGSSSVPQEFIALINKYGGNMPGSMGVPEEAIAQAAKGAVCKINIDTDLRLALTAKIREVFATKPGEFDPRKYLGPGRDAIKQMVKHKLHVLGCAGKADLCR